MSPLHRHNEIASLYALCCQIGWLRFKQVGATDLIVKNPNLFVRRSINGISRGHYPQADRQVEHAYKYP